MSDDAESETLTYHDDMLVRDIVYFFHECSNYWTIPPDLVYDGVLELPYYRYFQSPDPFIRQGSILIFLGMLEEWDAGSGFPFLEFQGRRRHPFEMYLSSLIHAYIQTNDDSASTTRPLLAVALADIAAIDERDPIDRNEDLGALDSGLVASFRSIVAERDLHTGSTHILSHQDVYLRYIKPYFIERCR